MKGGGGKKINVVRFFFFDIPKTSVVLIIDV